MLKIIDYQWTKYAEVDCKVEDLPGLLPLLGVTEPINGRRIGDRVAYAWPNIPLPDSVKNVPVDEVCRL